MKVTRARLKQIIKEELKDVFEAEVPKSAVKYLTAPAQEDGAGGIQSEMMKQVKALAQLLNYNLEEKEPVGLRTKGKSGYALDDLFKLVKELRAWASGEQHEYDFKDLVHIKNELAIVLTTINNLGDMRPDFRSAERALEFQVKRLVKVIESQAEKDSRKKPEPTGQQFPERGDTTDRVKPPRLTDKERRQRARRRGQEFPDDPYLTPSGRNMGFSENLGRIAKKVEERMVRRLRKKK